MHFNDLHLSPEILRAVAEQGYSTPTPIQQAAIPVILSGRDLLAAAQTGTGKTAAFTLPILEKLRIYSTPSPSPARHPTRAIILTPTRELADQVYTNAIAYGKYLSLRCALIFGGMAMQPQIQTLRAGAEIVIATPGRLLDHLQQKNLLLNHVELIVLDEADRMLDMGFIQDIRKILESIPTQRQTVLFSATFSPEIRKLADQFLKQPEMIQIASRAATSDDIVQWVHKVADSQKLALLIQLIRHHQAEQVLVFTRTKLTAERLSRQLTNAGLNAVSIHGDKNQTARLEALNAFKEGRARVLVATDIAARGLDITELPHVINFELPAAPEDYVHRIGRTGRAGATGVAISLASPEEERLLDAIEKFTKQTLLVKPIDELLPATAAYTASAAAVRRSGMALDNAPSSALSLSPHTRAPAAVRIVTQPQIAALLLPPKGTALVEIQREFK